jgi:hypothetical protein
MTVGLQRATIFAIVEEASSGEYELPSSGVEFVPLRPGNTLNFTAESLDSDELLNDIGSAKSFVGKESSEGSHSAYLRHSGIEGQAPQLGVMYESIMGDKSENSTEYAAAAGSNTEKIVVSSPENFYPGQAVMIKNGAGYEIRNVKEINSNDLILNFNATNSVPSGSLLGKAITYKPAPLGHPTFSATKYLGNGHAIEATAGNTVTELSVTADANGFGEVEFSYSGTRYFFNPVVVDATNKYIDFTDDDGTHEAFVAEKVYKTPIEFADALKSSMEASSPSGTYSVKYDKGEGTFTITATSSSVFSILFATGDNAANSVKVLMGYDTLIDLEGSLSYQSDIESDLSSPVSPSYDTSDAIIIKGAELFIGNSEDNLCVCAQTVNISISKEVQDVDCICEETGVKEKIATSRSVEMSVTAVLNKYDASLLDALLKNSGVGAMLNAGPKAGGNWVPGKCFNAYLQNCTVSSYTTTGDSFIQAEITLKGFVTSTSKDVYINFV